MRFVETKIPDVFIVEPQIFGDQRGFFMEAYSAQAWAQAIGETHFVQDNHSRSGRGVLRGLHYQLPPFAQGKLVRVTRGAVFDVAVDIRQSSPTFGQWVGAELTEANHRQLWVPAGFAHGFLTLTDEVDFLYKTTAAYAPSHERAIAWNDPDIGITWPETGVPLQLSAKDLVAPAFRDVKPQDLFA